MSFYLYFEILKSTVCNIVVDVFFATMMIFFNQSQMQQLIEK